MKEETLRVLKMVEEGKLSAEKATELLSAMDVKEEKSVNISDVYKKKMLTIKVDSGDGDKVNINLPVNVISSILKATGKLPIKMNGMDNVNIEEITQVVASALENETLGNIVDVQSADGDVVKIIIE